MSTIAGAGWFEPLTRGESDDTSLERHTLFTVLGTIVFAVSVPLAVWTGGACASSASLRRAARSAWSAVPTLANA